MPTPSLTLLNLLLTLLALYVPLHLYLNHRKLSQFPGPPFATTSRLWMFYHSLSARLPAVQIAALAKYGSPARIGPDLLISDDPDLVRHQNAAGSKWTRSGWYEGVKLDPRQESVFSTRDERLHAELKAKENGAVCLAIPFYQPHTSPQMRPL